MPRTRNIFNPKSKEPFKLSRSKIELFLQCPRCFYVDRRLGIGRVSGPPFTLNTATDTLLKKEFDSPCPAFKRLSADAGTLFVNRHNKQHTMSVYAQDRYRPLALVSQRLGVPLSHSDHDQIQKSGPGATCDRENSGNTQRIQRALCHSHLQNRLRSKPRPHPLPIPSHTLRGGMSLA